MKKLFSLLFVALLTLSAGAATVTFDFTSNGWGLPEGSANGATAEAQFTNGDGYTITLAATTSYYYNSNGFLMLGKSGSTLTFPAFDQKVVKIEVTGTGNASTSVKQNIYVGETAVSTETTGAKDVTNVYEIDEDYQTVGTIYTLKVTSAHNTQISKIVVTFEGTVEAPVFNPNGGEFTGSLAVTLSSASEPCDIFYFEGTPDGDWANYTHYSGEFYVTETKTYTAYASKGGVMSDYTTVTFTKVNPQVATPTFETPSGTFDDEQIVTINCATNGATIMYKINDGEYQEYDGAFSVTETSTIKAYGALEGYDNSDVATVTYTKNEPAPAASYELVTDVTTLQAGDKIALVGLNQGNAYVMSVKKSNNFGADAIVIENNKFSTDKAAVITLEQPNDSVWNLKVSAKDENGAAVEGYLYAAGSDKNYLKVEKTVDANGNANAAITAGENDAASIVFQGTNPRNVVQYNGGSTLFSCYASASQLPVYIYKQTSEVVLPAAPTISPESQEFTDPIEVTITNNEPGATVMYALNDGEFTEYTAAIPVSETTTVKAYATKDGVNSEMATATYTYKPAAITVATLAEVNALDSAAVFTFTGNIVVTFRNNSNIFVRDNANNSALIYQNGLDTAIDKGTTIAPNWGGTKTIYFNETEIINLENFTANGTQEVLPFERQSISSADYAAYVVIKNVAIDSTYVWGNRNTYVTNTGVIVRDNWQKGFSPETGKTYDIIGIVSAYQGTTVLNIVEVVGYVPEVNEVSTIAEATELGTGEEFTYVSEAVVVYQPAGDLRYTWIKDNSGYSLIYDFKKTVPAMEQGTVLKEGWSAQVDIYNGAKQFVSPQNVEASDDPAIVVNPIETATVTTADVHKYIIMKGQTLTATVNKTWANADGLLFYNKFNLPDSVLTIEEGKTYDVVGMVTTYTVSGEVVPEVFIISVTEVAAQQWALGDVNHDTFVNVADVTALIKYILTSGAEPEEFYTEQANVDGDEAGVLNVADVTSLIQVVLNQ